MTNRDVWLSINSTNTVCLLKQDVGQTCKWYWNCTSGLKESNRCGIICLHTPCPTKLVGGILDSPWLTVCRWHGCWSVTQVCFGISMLNFICLLFVAMSRNLLIFSRVAFKMATWWPFWIFWFPVFNFSLALNINSKIQHITCVYGKKLIAFQWCHFQDSLWLPFFLLFFS